MLLTGDEESVYGDSGYLGADRYKINRRLSQIRKKPARAQDQLRYRKTRYRELWKQTAKLNMLFALTNLILAEPFPQK